MKRIEPCLLLTIIICVQTVNASDQHAVPISSIDDISTTAETQDEAEQPAVPLLHPNTSTTPPQVPDLSTPVNPPGVEPNLTDGSMNRRTAGHTRQEKTCGAALQLALNKRIPILDLSGTADLNVNGITTVKEFVEARRASNSYGTGSNNIGVNLAATGATSDTITRILGELTEYKVVLNLSWNPLVNDDALNAIMQHATNVVALNVAGTQVTDAGASMLARNIPGNMPNLRSVNFSRTNVTQAGISELGAAVNNAQTTVQNVTQPSEDGTTDIPPIALPSTAPTSIGSSHNTRRHPITKS
ncbi:MAG: hypothetical protein LBD43_01505 [Holosporales bacterium]|nr:hypothetical protein [Holosporales bacterium]